MAMSSSASFGVVSCVSVRTVDIYLGSAILQTIEHLTFRCRIKSRLPLVALLGG